MPIDAKNRLPSELPKPDPDPTAAPALRELPDVKTRALKALLVRRAQLIEMLGAEKNRLRTVPRGSSAGSVRR